MFRSRLTSMLLSIPILLITVGCASNNVDLAPTGEARFTVSDNGSIFIQHAGLYQDKNGAFVRGRVVPGNRSHIPRPYAGHIDIVVMDAARQETQTKVVRLGGRQQYFFYRLPEPIAKNAQVSVEYSRLSHRQHAAKSHKKDTSSPERPT